MALVMATDGMRYSLVSRDIIADSIEAVCGAQYYDALIAIPGCDKNMPGCIMAMGRLNRPAYHGIRWHDCSWSLQWAGPEYHHCILKRWDRKLRDN